MIEFREPQPYDEKIDCCNNQVVAILQINSITIPLCMDCYESLVEGITEYKNKIFCKDCKYYIRNNNGSIYPGSCIKQAEEYNYKLEEYDIGFRYQTYNFDTCKNALKKTE